MANEKISQLPVASSVSGTDSTVIVSGGTNKQTLFSTIAAYIATLISNIKNSFNTVVVGVDGNDEPFVQGVETDGTTSHFKLAFDTHGNAEISGSTTLDVAARFTDDVITIGDVNDNQNSTKIVVDDANQKISFNNDVYHSLNSKKFLIEQFGGDPLFKVDGANGNIILGDPSADFNGQYISVQQTAPTIGIAIFSPNRGVTIGGSTALITVDDIGFLINLAATNGIKADGAIFPFADNAAAVAAIGAGKLYYTDVAGEYLTKMSH
jgi:hypothetical protein